PPPFHTTGPARTLMRSAGGEYGQDTRHLRIHRGGPCAALRSGPVRYVLHPPSSMLSPWFFPVRSHILLQIGHVTLSPLPSRPSARLGTGWRGTMRCDAMRCDAVYLTQRITAVPAVTGSHPSIVERAYSGNASGRCVVWGLEE